MSNHCFSIWTIVGWKTRKGQDVSTIWQGGRRLRAVDHLFERHGAVRRRDCERPSAVPFFSVAVQFCCGHFSVSWPALGFCIAALDGLAAHCDRCCDGSDTGCLRRGCCRRRPPHDAPSQGETAAGSRLGVHCCCLVAGRAPVSENNPCRHRTRWRDGNPLVQPSTRLLDVPGKCGSPSSISGEGRA